MPETTEKTIKCALDLPVNIDRTIAEEAKRTGVSKSKAALTLIRYALARKAALRKYEEKAKRVATP